MKAATKRAALSRERILRAALAIVDRDGFEAISMRRLGEELGVEAMSLYNHVANKAAILDGIFETVLAELPAAASSAPWPAALRERAGALRTVLRAHPNALPIFATRPAVTPAAITHIEVVLDILRGAGVSPVDAVNALQVLFAFVVGHTVAAYAPRNLDDESHPAYRELDRARYPRVHEVARILDDHDLDHEFAFGLDAMLTGLEARLAARARRKR